MSTPGNVPPLYVFYAIHVHAAGDHLPYTDPSMTRLDEGVAQNMLSAIEGIAQQVGWGIHAATINLSVGSLFEWCEGSLGVGNDMAQGTGNLMFPWRPDYKHQNICADDPEGDFVFVDHSPMPWWTDLDGQGVADVLTDANFERLKELFDAALRYMEENRPERVAAWGFVTHVHEFMPGSQGKNPPDEATLALWDAFWSYVAQQAAAGRVIFVTAEEVAQAAFGQAGPPAGF